MTPHLRRGIVALGSVALLVAVASWPAVAAQTLERSAGPIPEILDTQSAGFDRPSARASEQRPKPHPTHLWVEELRHAVVVSQESYPRSDFDPYLDKLDRVREAMEKADRSAVAAEMTAFFSMLAKQDNGIEHDAATEVRKMAHMLTPFNEFRITVPQASGGQQSTDGPRSPITQ